MKVTHRTMLVALATLIMALLAPSLALAQGPTITVAQNPTLGAVLADSEGRTLYRFTRDVINTSSACYGTCADRWPPVLVEDGIPLAGEGVNGGLLGILTRTDGKQQVMYNGMPLYYFANDTAAGQTNGQGVNNVWYIVKPNTTTVGGQGVTVKATASTSLGTILTDGAGRTLYLFTRDSPNTTTCYDRCATAWPPLLVGAGVEPALEGASGTLATIMRNDGNRQVTYNGAPLYYYVNDTAPGETKGQGVNNVWYIINPPAQAAAAPPAAPEAPAALPNTATGDQAPITALFILAILAILAGFGIRLLRRPA